MPQRTVGRLNPNTEDTVLLHRIDVSKNMARFYAMQLRPTLLSETAVVRHWGRIGTQGQMRLDTFKSHAEAHTVIVRLHAKKSRRGYRGPALLPCSAVLSPSRTSSWSNAALLNRPASSSFSKSGRSRSVSKP